MSTTGVGGSILSGSEATSSSGGLGSGIDVSGLVAAAMADQTAELQLMQGQQTTLTTEQTSLTSFNTDVQTLQSAVFALTDPAGALTDVVATSSDPDSFTASAISGVTSGTHTVTVANLATTSSAYSTPVTAATIPNGSLSIQVGTNTAVPITINSTDNTLAGLAQAINNTNNIGVTASVITDANGSRLAIVSNSSGLPGTLTITPSAGEPTFTTSGGTNANLTIDGVPIASTTNTVAGVLPGITLNLTGPSSGPVSLTTGPDVTSQAAALNSFVTAYNTVIGDLNTQFAVSATTNEPGPLASDSTLSLAQGQLLSSVSFSMTGNGAVQSLADLGITMADDGTLSVDSSTLAATLQTNPSAVSSFFQGTGTGSFGANLDSVLSTLADPVSGAITQDINGLAQTQTSLTQQIADFQTQMASQSAALTTQYDTVDTTLQELPLLLQQVTQQLQSLG